ncbi:MAG: metallophosphoesterase [Chloroflexota bacterium]
MRIALLADIHGNWPALQAVLQKLKTLDPQPDMVVVNGDLINCVPFNQEVLNFVMDTDWVVVRGNHEFYYLNFGTERAEPGSDDPVRWGGLHWLVKQITPEQGAYMATLPDVRTFYIPGTSPICVTHGVPGRNRVGFNNRQSDSEIASAIRSVSQPTLVSAHTHVQVDRYISWEDPEEADSLAYANPQTYPPKRQQWHVINPGSVGLPLNGDPAAQFAVIDSVDESDRQNSVDGWRVTHYRVSYDITPCLEAYLTSGLLEAGSVIGQLFYWELITAEPEIVFFYRWANGVPEARPEEDIAGAFAQYIAATGREAYVKSRDPLYALDPKRSGVSFQSSRL